MQAIIKRNGLEVPFNADKIRKAIIGANNDVPPSDRISMEKIDEITSLVKERCNALSRPAHVEEIQDFVEMLLWRYGTYQVSKAFQLYRYTHTLKRESNTTDEAILSLIGNTNKEMAEENSNKNTTVASTQRDYIAGIVSRDLTTRVLLPKEISEAHESGMLHFHDADYFIEPIFNCCLINIGDMLDNGTMMNGKLIESPKSFQVACTVMTQIIACVASNQYGGQSVDVSHLGKYLRRSREKFRKKISETVYAMHCELSAEQTEAMISSLVDERVRTELKNGVQTIQYQINTLMTTNGQAPFVTLFLYLRDDDPYQAENAMIIEEILRQRIEGIKNESGVYITPAFPKLVYVLDENNNLTGGKFDYLTELAVRCSAKRMYPDYISAKKMRENYEGNVFSPMGCVDGREVISYRLYGIPYVESFERMWSRVSSMFVPRQQIEGCPEHMFIDADGLEIYDTKKMDYTKVSRVIRNTSSNWKRVKFGNGRSITCTADHPFETENRGVVYAKNLKNSDVVRINTGSPVPDDGMIPYNTDKAWMLGFLLCDSSYVESVTASIAAKGEDEIAEKFSAVLNSHYGFDLHIIDQHRGYKGNYKDLRVTAHGNYGVSKLSAELISLFGGKNKKSRHIPNEVFTWNRDARMAFLAGIIDADGYINDNMGLTKIQIGSVNKELALQEMYLAQSLGFRAFMYLNHYRANNRSSIRYRVEFIPSTELIAFIQCQKKRQHFKNNVRMKTSIAESDFASPVEILDLHGTAFSYDVTTESEHFEVSGIYSHNCRSFLAPWKNEKGEYQFEGRFNQGVVSINLPQIGLAVHGDMDKFWPEFDRRLIVCRRALMCRHKALLGTKSDTSPIHWQYGAIARLDKGETIDKLLYGGYSSISLGYIGLYELTYVMTGKSHTSPEGQEFALKVMNHLRETVLRWKAETNIGFALYGTPAESLCYRFARIDKEKYGNIENVTDKGYYTNSYHVDVREEIDIFSKFAFENQFQPLSAGGCISYGEIPDMRHNITALKDIVRFIYDNIQYAEFNTRSDYCQVCGYDGEIIINDDLEWECPCCGNKDHRKMNVVRRTCGYLGENFWNVGKTKEIQSRVLHLT